MRPLGNVSPNNGGCWYCQHDDGDLVFCREFDTYVHKECAATAAQDGDDDEAQIIWSEVEDY